MTHAEWLALREPEAPRALIDRITPLLAAHREWESLARADAFVEASELLLRRVLDGNGAARASALDLLASDACITYAFEAASDDPATIGHRAAAAMGRIAGITREYTPGALSP
jgi:hypothetical protein